MTEVTVNAVPHLWRVNFERPYGAPETVQGYNETILTAIDNPSQVLGSTPSEIGAVHRKLADVAAESVTISTGNISFGEIAEALPLFLERWTQEDKEPQPPLE